jgi:hypothetical protein
VIDSICNLLKATALFKQVIPSHELGAIDDYTEETPAAVVYMDGVSFGENSIYNGVSQSATRTIAVLLACHVDDIERLEWSILGALVGYQPDPDHEAMEAVSIENLNISGAFYIRKILFKSKTYFRKTR